jgi:ABC-2 type transport system ATP-binding protein
MLAEINTSQNCTILLSSHILSEVEKICTHAAVIHHGKLLFQGSMSELLSDNQGVINIEIQVGQPEKALNCLKPEYHPVKDADKIKLRVTKKEEIALIIQQLVNEGVDIYSVENTCNTLESNFLNLLSIK